jgi:transposase
LLTPAQKDELKQIVLAGPDLAKDGVVRWRCVDLQRVIKERFKVTMAERTVAKLLHALGLSRLTPRPRHPKQAPQAQEDFKKASRRT